MADDQQPPTPPADPPQDDPETAFWAKLDDHLNGWWDKKNPPKQDSGKKDEPAPLGKTRTGGKRVTLSSLFADAVFGPQHDD